MERVTRSNEMGVRVFVAGALRRPLSVSSHLICTSCFCCCCTLSLTCRSHGDDPGAPGPGAGEPVVRPDSLDPCLDSRGRYKVVPSVVCSMCCLFGVIYCFFGYRCFKAVMFLTGLMFGSVVIFMLCYKERVLDTQLSVEAAVGIGLGIGTLCGLVTMLVRSVGLFMVGLLLGLLVAVATLVGMEELSDAPPRSVWIPLGVLLGLGMLFAVLTLQWQRLFTTLSTAAFGAAVITVATDYFVELFRAGAVHVREAEGGSWSARVLGHVGGAGSVARPDRARRPGAVEGHRGGILAH
ncbi:hypothetical protein WMY93_031607 [Mugilogobius chulae]|uniref:Transmembrane protein 198 n=1 Tax=Mugilogobius chulae TaxID=88201 RepID=A0AAW0MDA2_9GOBI